MKVFIGWDSREDIAYQVCRESLARNSSVHLNIHPIKQSDMRDKNLYWKEHDPLSSTEFSFTRFLVPCLSEYKGWSVFMDCDFLWRGDIAGLMDYADPRYAALVVKHDYKPTETIKMDGATQTQYPRKNWSSLVLWNCSHPQTKRLTAESANRSTGLYLHRFGFLDDEVIGELPIAYNYLEGWHTKNDCQNPVAVHFTRGGPWFKGWGHVEYAEEWFAVAKEM